MWTCWEEFYEHNSHAGFRHETKMWWSFYLHPDCSVMIAYSLNPHIYTGNCPNDEIFPQWPTAVTMGEKHSTSSSIYLEKMRNSSSNALKFVHYQVREAMRIAEKARHDYVLPAFVFCSPFYLHSIEILSHVRNSTSTHKNVTLVKLLYNVYENGIFL